MKITKTFIYLMIVNLLVLSGIAFAQSSNQQLAYEIGSIYAGIILGTNFALIVQPYKDIRGKPLGEALGILFQRRTKWLRGGTEEYAAVIGISLLLVIMTIIGNYEFFGHSFGSNKITSVIAMGSIGAIYGLILLINGLWFDYWIWQRRPMYYALALLVIFFILSIVAAFSNEFIRTPFFVVGIVSRAISIIAMNKWNYSIGKNNYIYAYAAVCLLLLIPIFCRI